MICGTNSKLKQNEKRYELLIVTAVRNIPTLVARAKRNTVIQYMRSSISIFLSTSLVTREMLSITLSKAHSYPISSDPGVELLGVGVFKISSQWYIQQA